MKDERGVFEELPRPEGARAFTIVSSRGKWLRRSEVKDELATDAFEADLWRWLDDVDPVGLRIII